MLCRCLLISGLHSFAATNRCFIFSHENIQTLLEVDLVKKNPLDTYTLFSGIEAILDVLYMPTLRD